PDPAGPDLDGRRAAAAGRQALADAAPDRLRPRRAGPDSLPAAEQARHDHAAAAFRPAGLAARLPGRLCARPHGTALAGGGARGVCGSRDGGHRGRLVCRLHADPGGSRAGGESAIRLPDLAILVGIRHRPGHRGAGLAAAAGAAPRDGGVKVYWKTIFGPRFAAASRSTFSATFAAMAR